MVIFLVYNVIKVRDLALLKNIIKGEKNEYVF
jgi:hypothetical protein